jgi:hypothetical protein
MSEADPFADFARRICAGGEPAAADLLCHYESLVPRAVRLRRLFDAPDVCQSVLASLWLGAPQGRM